ncbi:CVNH domain-containing protein [Nostoc sp.]|uniref:CVNH domain-containing protein n=1 Tax=Nostoc sp. TaxID=1180 RepID=UPI002FFA5916
MKSKFLNSIIILGSTVISVFSLAIGYKYVLAVPSSYQYSCPTELLQGTMLEANCLTTDGKSQPFTTLILKGIHVNSSGQLTQNALSGTSTFLNECYSFSPYLYITMGIIKAKCKNLSHTYKNTSIRLEEITNHNGKLTYEWDRIIDQTAFKITTHAFYNHYAEFSLPKNNNSKAIMSVIAKDV